MKYAIKLENIEVRGIKVGAVECNVELTISEIRELYALSREILNDSPEIIGGIANAYKAYCDKDLEVRRVDNEHLKQCDAIRHEFEQEKRESKLSSFVNKILNEGINQSEQPGVEEKEAV